MPEFHSVVGSRPRAVAIEPAASPAPGPRGPAIDIGIPEKDRRKIAKELSKFLADSYTLYLKTHNYHWNVVGPMFNTLHLMFETQYNELALAVDLICRDQREARLLSAMMRRSRVAKRHTCVAYYNVLTNSGILVGALTVGSAAPHLIRGVTDLPWRQTRDPWEVLVCEVMAQQTQVARVAERAQIAATSTSGRRWNPAA